MGNLIRVEAGTKAKFDEPNREEAFRRAAHLIMDGHETVKVWLHGARNMPIELTEENFREMRRVHG